MSTHSGGKKFSEIKREKKRNVLKLIRTENT